MAAVAVLREECLAISPYPAQLTIDCSAVDVVSAAGGQLLIAYQKSLSASGSALVLEGVSARMHEDLHLLGMQRLLQPTREGM